MPVERFLDAGATMFVLRMGAGGSLLASQSEPMLVYVPAAEANVVDVTGCGNVYNGAMVAALQRGRSLAESGAWGSAAASMMAEAEGAALATACLIAPRGNGLRHLGKYQYAEILRTCS